MIYWTRQGKRYIYFYNRHSNGQHFRKSMDQPGIVANPSRFFSIPRLNWENNFNIIAYFREIYSRTKDINVVRLKRFYIRFAQQIPNKRYGF